VYFSADTPISFGVCSMLVKTKERFYTDVAIYTKHFAQGLQSAAAPSTEWTSITSDVDIRSPRPGHNEIRIFVTPYPTFRSFEEWFSDYVLMHLLLVLSQYKRSGKCKNEKTLR
jgi:hypothetical protein